MGTVELGMPYGFVYDGEPQVPDRREAKRLLLAAFDAGINLVDTSPTYGSAEVIVGEALKEWHGPEVLIAEKIPTWGDRFAEDVERSLRRLGREWIDLLQVYSRAADCDVVLRVLEVGRRLVAAGKARALGITIYDETIGLIAAESEDVRAIQLPFNLLDRRMASRVIPAAESRGIAIWTRSALLKGILTDRRNRSHHGLTDLVIASNRLAARCGLRGVPLCQAALRFCLSQAGIDSVLVGIRNEAELRAALETLESGDNAEWLQDYVYDGDPALLDPRNWDSPNHEKSRRRERQ
ncbi:MAG: aldo/keto reductase [Acidobacteriota bacterium]